MKDCFVHSHPSLKNFPKYWQPKLHLGFLSRQDVFRNHEIQQCAFQLAVFYFLCWSLPEFNVLNFVALRARNLLFIAMTLAVYCTTASWLPVLLLREAR